MLISITGKCLVSVWTKKFCCHPQREWLLMSIYWWVPWIRSETNFELSVEKKFTVVLFCDKPPAVSPDKEDQAPAESTTTLLYSRDTSRMEGEHTPHCVQCSSIFHCCVLTLSYFPPADVTSTFNQVIVTKCPESCWTFLKKLEKRGNPHTDPGLLNKLKDFYSKIFCKMPIRQFSKNSSYARMLIRYAELKGWVWLQNTGAALLLMVWGIIEEKILVLIVIQIISVLEHIRLPTWKIIFFSSLFIFIYLNVFFY